MACRWARQYVIYERRDGDVPPCPAAASSAGGTSTGAADGGGMSRARAGAEAVHAASVVWDGEYEALSRTLPPVTSPPSHPQLH